MIFENTLNVAKGGPGGLQLFCGRLPALLSLNGSKRVLDQFPMNADLGYGSGHHPVLFKQLIHRIPTSCDIFLCDEASLRRFNH